MASKKNSANDLGLTLGMLTLRIWLGFRAIQTGMEKFAGSKANSSVVDIDGVPNSYGLTKDGADKFYSFSEYHGVPVPLYDKFNSEPFIPTWGLNLYDTILGPALILLGLTVLLGIAQRISLFAMGLLYTSLTFGLILINQSSGVAWLGVHIIMVVMALALAKYNRFAVLKKW
ncbi:MAG: thiosulfate dehydrogenase [quinone] large subunit [Lentimonas sp.]|jgi:thiosulfate dehydrogenase [quinone] large subunit